MSLIHLTRSSPRHAATAWTLPQHRASFLVRAHVLERHRLGTWSRRPSSDTDAIARVRLVNALKPEDRIWLEQHGWSA